MLNDNEREIKMKLAKSYAEELAAQKARFEVEKQRRLKEEQFELKQIQTELEKEQQILNERKKQIASLQYSDYLASLEAKRLKELHDYEAKLKASNVSLPMNSDERLSQYKNYISSLSDKTDKYSDNYLKYAERNKSAKFFSPLTQKISIIKPVNQTCESAKAFSPMSTYPDKKEVLNTNNNIRPLDYKNNKTYEEYKKLSKEFNEYNKNKVDMDMKHKQEMFFQRYKLEQSRKAEMERLAHLRKEEKEFEMEKKRKYKEYLDSQVKTQINEKLRNESYAISAVEDKAKKFNNDELYQYRRDCSFLNKNNFVEVNPYRAKRYDLGECDLEYNPILNPMFNYKYNRYLFPRPTSSSSVLQNVGTSTMLKSY